MSESAWQVIIKAYERELANAKTPEEAARWQAAIDNSLTEANKEIIVSEGRVRPTAEQKARKIELGKEKAAVADQQRLIDEGRIKIFPAEESANMLAEDTAAVNSTKRPSVAPSAEPVIEKPPKFQIDRADYFKNIYTDELPEEAISRLKEAAYPRNYKYIISDYWGMSIRKYGRSSN
jgi:hypothetical protein